MEASEIRRRIGRRVIAADFGKDWFNMVCKELALQSRMHRKVWELVSIAQVYRDSIGEGGRVIGFGVGREPLPAWFAQQGATVLATDKPEADYWLPDQHAKSREELPYKGICERRIFDRNVSFVPVDMTDLEKTPLPWNFDLTWSASCFEHLGSIALGLDFFCSQMKLLRPGGVAVHVTEYNFLSNDATLEAHNLVAFRNRDFEELRQRLARQGDTLLPFDASGGSSEADLFVDEAPYQAEPHLNLRLAGHSFTSALLIAQRGA
jgi:hypothetical protein